MSTNEKCFVCKNKIQPIDNITNNIKQRQECKRFNSLVCRYLNIVDNGIDVSSQSPSNDPNKTLSPIKNILLGDKPISCCDICIPQIKSFCDTYNDWKILQLKLSWKLETIVKLMLMKSEINQSGEPGHQPGLEIFRNTFLTAATDKSRDFPHLNIPKVNVAPLFQNNRVATEEIMDISGVESPELSDAENDYLEDNEDIQGSKLQDNVQEKSGLEVKSMSNAEPKAERKTTLKSHHEDTAKKSVIYACQFCRKEFKHKFVCTRHEQNHSGVKPYKCRYNCGKRFSRDFNRKKHEISIHKRNLAKHQCQFCAKKYVTNSTLIDHLRTHTGEKPFSCCVCNKQFSMKCNWKTHERRHTKRQMQYDEMKRRDQSNSEYKCTFCPKKFEFKNAQIMHEKVHSKDTSYSCRYCDKSFCHLYRKERHQLTHKPRETKGVSSNNKILKKVKQEVEQLNNDATSHLEDGVGIGNNGEFHNNTDSEAILVRIVKSENDNLESY